MFDKLFLGLTVQYIILYCPTVNAAGHGHVCAHSCTFPCPVDSSCCLLSPPSAPTYCIHPLHPPTAFTLCTHPLHPQPPTFSHRSMHPPTASTISIILYTHPHPPSAPISVPALCPHQLHPPSATPVSKVNRLQPYHSICCAWYVYLVLF